MQPEGLDATVEIVAVVADPIGSTVRCEAGQDQARVGILFRTSNIASSNVA